MELFDIVKKEILLINSKDNTQNLTDDNIKIICDVLNKRFNEQVINLRKKDSSKKLYRKWFGYWDTLTEFCNKEKIEIVSVIKDGHSCGLFYYKNL